MFYKVFLSLLEVMLGESDFLDETGRQIPVSFEEERTSTRVISYVRNLVGV